MTQARPPGAVADRDLADVLPAAAAVDQALFRLYRLWARRPLRKRLNMHVGAPVDLSQVRVVGAVGTGQELGQEVTVGMVAEQLEIDPSTASRLVNEAINAGYLSRAASSVDARRARLELTDAGRELREAARRFRIDYIDRVMGDWSQEEREELARLLAKFAESVAAYRPEQGA